MQIQISILRGHTERNELSAELQPVRLWTHLQTWGKSQGGEEGGEAPAQLREAADVLHLVHRAELGVCKHFTLIDF